MCALKIDVQIINYQSMADSVVLPFRFFFHIECCFRKIETFFMLMSKLLCLSYDAFGLCAAFLHFQGCK